MTIATAQTVTPPPSQSGAASRPAAAPLVIEDVTVIDVQAGRPLRHQTVILADRRIQAVAAAGLRPPPGAQVVSGRGRYLIPGLWDMHIHGAWLDVLYPVLLANGITGIRDVGSQVPPDTLRWWRQEIAAGRRVGPRQPIILGPLYESNGGQDWTPERARYVVDSTKAAGAEFFKLHEVLMPRESYFVLLSEARRVGLSVVGHLPLSISVEEASDSGQRTIEHISWMMASGRPCPDTSQKTGLPRCRPDLKNFPRGHWLGLCDGDSATVETCTQLAQRFRRNGTWFTPTLIHLQPYRPIISHLPYIPNSVKRRRLRSKPEPLPGGRLFRSDSAYSAILSLMVRAGMPILAGTDQYGAVNATVHEEMAALVKNGLTPLAALQTATLNPAQYLGVADSLGTVTAGKLADLVLLDANPLTDIRHTVRVRAVIADGRYFDRSTLDSLLAGVDHRVKEGCANRIRFC